MMLRNLLPSSILLASLLALPFPAISAALENIPLVWKPTSATTTGTVDLSALGSARIRIDVLADQRENARLIGENREDAPKVLPVTSRDEVAPFVTRQLAELLAGYGLNVVKGGETVVVTGEIRRFFVTETNQYRGDVALLITVRSPAGEERWNAIVSGSVKRFGRSYKAENYYEVLSDSLIEVVNRLVRSEGFKRALAGR